MCLLMAYGTVTCVANYIWKQLGANFAAIQFALDSFCLYTRVCTVRYFQLNGEGSD